MNILILNKFLSTLSKYLLVIERRNGDLDKNENFKIYKVKNLYGFP